MARLFSEVVEADLNHQAANRCYWRDIPTCNALASHFIGSSGGLNTSSGIVSVNMPTSPSSRFSAPNSFRYFRLVLTGIWPSVKL
jgi:hypothetical protein